MTPEELKQMRLERDLTQVQLGEKIAYTARQIIKWEQGKVKIPVGAVRLMKLVLK